jgi:hypothetical protein
MRAANVSVSAGDGNFGESEMSEYSQLANAMLVLTFAAGMFIAGQMFMGYQSTHVAVSTTYIASFPW